jgi:Na+-transporting NADH:ubiquinone oxidoreductase subunit B
LKENVSKKIMKALRNLFEKIEPHVKPGGKYEMLHTTYDAFYTFLFTPANTTHSGVHIKDGIDLKRTMIMVVFAMVPCLLFGMWNAGHQHFLSTGETVDFMEKFLYGMKKVLPIVIVSYGVGLSVEFIFATVKKHSIEEGFLVSGMLIPLIMPPTIPLWMVAVATIFAVIFAKEVFGGTGMNILNVALTARVFLFFAYPSFMSGDLVWIAEQADGFSGATTLGLAAADLPINYSFMDMFLGFEMGSIGETSALACLIGAAILLITGIGSWRVMLSVFGGGFLMALLLNAIGGNALLDMPAHIHLVAGGFAFGAVFMATDPVTAAQTNTGKYIYGFLIGVLAILIRTVNPAYPEGIMLAILLMNVFAPLIDHNIIQANIKRRLARAK